MKDLRSAKLKKGVVLLSVLMASTAYGGDDKAIDVMSMPAAQLDKLLVVDCLLPGQVRKLGAMTQYLTPRRPIKTSAVNCEIRGGEYVAYDRANAETSLKVWLPQAEEGSAEAQNYVGEIYERGMGVSPDFAVAAQWYRKAAEQKYTRAQINLGFLYERGLGVKQDMTEAMNWYRQASGLGDGQLEYVSTIEAVSRTQQAAELAALRSENEKLSAESKKYKDELASSQHKLQQALAEQKKLESSYASLQERKKTLDAQLNASAKERKQLELALQESRNQLNSNNTAVAQLEKQTQQINSKLEQIKQQKEQVALGPSITITSPLLTVTRGTPVVRFRSIQTVASVSGKVIAPAGVKSLKINEQLEKFAQDGQFNAQIPVKGLENKITVKALDSKDREAMVEFLVKREDGAVTAAELAQNAGDNKSSAINFGRYHAIIIGNNEYKHLPRLDTAVNDAKRVDKVLREKYGFNTTLLLNADRRSILATLYQLRERLGDQDNLLIYYAGHGDMDRVNDRGYWLPVDADESTPANWISNDAVTDVLNTLSAKHIMLVVDSCYSGTMSRTAMPQLDVNLSEQMRNQWLSLMNKRRSRTVLTSGGLQPVLDNGGNGESVFAHAFVNALQKNNQLLMGYNLYREVMGKVSAKSTSLGSSQTPEYAPIKRSGHETGQFVFVPAS